MLVGHLLWASRQDWKEMRSLDPLKSWKISSTDGQEWRSPDFQQMKSDNHWKVQQQHKLPLDQRGSGGTRSEFWMWDRDKGLHILGSEGHRHGWKLSTMGNQGHWALFPGEEDRPEAASSFEGSEQEKWTRTDPDGRNPEVDQQLWRWWSGQEDLRHDQPNSCGFEFGCGWSDWEALLEIQECLQCKQGVNFNGTICFLWFHFNLQIKNDRF